MKKSIYFLTLFVVFGGHSLGAETRVPTPNGPYQKTCKGCRMEGNDLKCDICEAHLQNRRELNATLKNAAECKGEIVSTYGHLECSVKN